MTRKQALIHERQVTEALKARRIEKKVSHEKLAQMTGLSRAGISMMESGQRHPTLLTCLRIALALDELEVVVKKLNIKL